MSKIPSIACVLVATCLGGCANTFGGVDIHHATPTMIAISQPANVRSAYTNGQKVCPEPPPDAALQAVANAAVKVSTKAGAAVDVSGGLTTSVVQLAGRTQVVLIARDAFTANCILEMNGYITQPDAEANFKQTLDVIQTIANADKASADADATKANTEAAKVAVAASPSTDPAVKDAVAKLSQSVNTDADTVVKSLTNAQGVYMTDAAVKFFGQDDVKALLTPPVADMLSQTKSGTELNAYLSGAYFRESGALAALAKNFKG